MRVLALFVGYFGVFGFGAAAFSLAMHDARGRPLVFGLGAFVMGLGGILASRLIRRRHSKAEAAFYIWALCTAIFYGLLPIAFPYAFAGRTDMWPSALIGAALFGAFVLAGGRYIRHRAPAA